jgi:hypothetical protein
VPDHLEVGKHYHGWPWDYRLWPDNQRRDFWCHVRGLNAEAGPRYFGDALSYPYWYPQVRRDHLFDLEAGAYVVEVTEEEFLCAILSR